VAEAFWDDKGVRARPSGLVACFAGTMGRQFNFGSVLSASRLLAQRGVPFQLVLCGSGECQAEVALQAKDIPNVCLAGRVDAAQIHVLMRRSSLGLDPMPSRFDFLATINNKAIEYFSAGLPVISSPDRGVLKDLLHEERCGLSYPDGDSDALARILEHLASEPDELASLAANASRVFRERFVAETVYAHMADYLDEVVASCSGRGQAAAR
jgi:glycosyltransferase involved in cell wall biosynthesis